MSKTRTPLDELAKLLENPSHNLSVDVYNGNKKTIKEPSVKRRKPKYTLNEIGDAVMQLTSSFTSFKKEVNERFDRIEGRLDYNGLKQLPKNR